MRNQPIGDRRRARALLRVEPALISVLSRRSAATARSSRLPLGDPGHPAGGTFGFDEIDVFSPGLAVLAMLAWIGVFFALAAVLLKRRDVE